MEFTDRCGRLADIIRRLTTLTGAVAAALLIGALTASADLPPGGTFIDDDGNIHEGSIEAIVDAGITTGCDARKIRFCPDMTITRGQMAAFLSRALNLPPAGQDHFADDTGHLFENDINKIAELGITRGCNPPENTRFCPDHPVRRTEMATFLARAFADLVPDSAEDAFTDDNGNPHEPDINRIAAAGITKGCNSANTLYCPRDVVTRAQMASFLTRALGLQPIHPPPQFPIERVSRFTTYFDCCQPRVTNIKLIAKAVDGYVVMPGETFSIDRVVGQRTSAKGYVPAPYLQGGEGKCCAIGGGVSQFGTTIHNAVFWAGYPIDHHRPHTGWISRYPLGIEATLVYSSIDYRFTNDTVTPIYIETSTTSTSVTVDLWGYQGGWEMRGSHPRGNRSSSITILDHGDSSAKRVSARVTGSAPGWVKIVRTLTQNGVSSSQTWNWFYQG